MKTPSIQKLKTRVGKLVTLIDNYEKNITEMYNRELQDIDRFVKMSSKKLA